MPPRLKIALLIFTLNLPVGAFFAYFVYALSKNPDIVFPSWLADVTCGYISVSVLTVYIARRRLAPGTPQELAAKAQRQARSLVMRLLAFCCCVLIYGIYKATKGELPLSGAIRGGIILLAFVCLFSWWLYRDQRARKNPTKSG